MKINDILIALLVAVIWGVNFVVIKVGVTGIPPLFLGALRFLFVALPAVFFIPRPKIALSRLVIYGLTICFGQFAFLFSAVKAGCRRDRLCGIAVGSFSPLFWVA